jgi:SAM-dependent methyltransferase
LFRIFRGGAAPADPLQQPAARQERITRRSSGLAEFARNIAGQENLRILDLGPTSPANIEYLTNLGHKIYNEDVLLASTDPTFTRKDEDGKPVLDAELFMAENLVYEPELFDAVLAWDVPDFAPEPLIKPMIERIYKITKPKGILLGFFHTKDLGHEAPCYRYHISQPDMLQLQPMWKPGQESRGKRIPMFRMQRVFANRTLENLFHEFASMKFFLARDNIREVLAVR